MVWANVTEMGGWNISKTPYAPEKWTFFWRAPEGPGEADLPPEALEKQTFLRMLRRNRPSSGGSRETDLPPEPLEKQTFLWSLRSRDITVPSGTGPRPGPDRDRTKLHGTMVWSGHGPKVVQSWSGASLDFQDRSWTRPMLRREGG